MKKYIYHLEKDGIPFYIGYTTQLKGRLATHKGPKKFNDKNIEICEIDYTEDWKEAEKYWIAQYKAWGFDLLNKNTEGGGGPSTGKWTNEFKKEMDRIYSKNRYDNISDEGYNKLCVRNKKWKEENKERQKKYNQQYYINNPDKFNKSKNICPI